MVSNGGHGTERQVAVLIDVENVGLGSIQWLFDQISDYGRVTIKRAYADWSSVTRGARSQMVELGIEPDTPLPRDGVRARTPATYAWS